MKPLLDGFCVVTATIDMARAYTLWRTYAERATFSWLTYVVGCELTAPPARNDPAYRFIPYEGYGVVGPFATGVAAALADGHQIICCLHDDVEIAEDDWDARVHRWFEEHPACGLAGFGGGTGLADEDIYRTPYEPVQLARKDFVSNMRDAKLHGRRGERPERVACLDGFSQIGRRVYWQGCYAAKISQLGRHNFVPSGAPNLFQRLYDLGVHHHMYDGALGAYAKRLGWEVWMLPIACHHLGGVTAVGDPRYADWLAAQGTDDAEVWERSHQAVYDEFKDCLPIRV